MVFDPVQGCVRGRKAEQCLPDEIPHRATSTDEATANSRQVGGAHYSQMSSGGLQHWDVVALLGLDYFQGCITKYVFRWRLKGGVEDLKKARHYLDKYIELIGAGMIRCPAPARGTSPVASGGNAVPERIDKESKS